MGREIYRLGCFFFCGGPDLLVVGMLFLLMFSIVCSDGNVVYKNHTFYDYTVTFAFLFFLYLVVLCGF